MNHEKLTSTHKRLTLIFTGVVFCIVLILGLSILGAKYYNELRTSKRDFERNTLAITNIIETDATFPTSFLTRQVREKRERFGEIRKEFGDSPLLSTSFFIVNENNDIVFQNILEKPSFAEILDTNNDVYIDDNTLIRSIALRSSDIGSRVTFFKTLQYGSGELFEEILLLLGTTLLFTVLFYFIGYRFVGRALKPVEENLSDMGDFIHNAGHELKTPLAVMRGNMQVMQVEQSFDQKLLQENIKQVDAINNLIEGLRELSEVGKTKNLENLFLSQEIDEITANFTQNLQNKNIELNVQVSPNFRVYTNKQELHILLSNLIKNAITYNKQDGKIDIISKKNTLEIQDTGVGISDKDTQKVFNRFYQGSVGRSSEGHGIGLSLVQKIAQTNNWKIVLESEEGKGTSFKIIF
ncbi:HAMP domain-containing histidine kinase [Candidatus Gracilibacteria bacterium]|nr:HAMP domain-containing histidine kinase [Candidatus Gracilibacteria bacterium]